MKELVKLCEVEEMTPEHLERAIAAELALQKRLMAEILIRDAELFEALAKR